MPLNQIVSFSDMLTVTKVFTVGILIMGMIGYGGLLIAMYFFDKKRETRATLEKSPELSFGLPFSAIASFGVVALLESTGNGNDTAGNLSFKAFGLDFNGPAGPVTLWLLCFGAFVLAIKHLRRV